MRNRVILGGLLLLFLTAVPGWAEPPRALVFGIFPYANSGKLIEHHKAFKDYLERELKQPIKMVSAPDMESFITRTREGTYDLILTAPNLGRLAQQENGYVPLAMTRHQIQGVFLVPRDSSITRLENLRGKTITLSTPTTMIYQMSLQTLREHGLENGRNITVRETSTQQNAIFAPALGESDASATGVTLWTQLDPAEQRKLRVLAKTHSVAGFFLMAHPRLSEKQISQIRQLAFRFSSTPEGKGYVHVGYAPLDDATMRSVDPYTMILKRVP
jgi:phosphonate transport system substrate-binding protein